MALSPDANDENFRDPFQIDRLAEELVHRELSIAYGREPLDPINGDVPDLPEYTPLSHNDPLLTEEKFDVEEFLLARKQTLLPDLRTELRQYLAQLKEELVKLINDDYEAFISLSTDLKDEGARLERLKSPMATLRENVLVSRLLFVSLQS